MVSTGTIPVAREKCHKLSLTEQYPDTVLTYGREPFQWRILRGGGGKREDPLGSFFFHFRAVFVPVRNPRSATMNGVINERESLLEILVLYCIICLVTFGENVDLIDFG